MLNELKREINGLNTVNENHCKALLHLENQHYSFSISPSNEYSGLISLRTDWFDLQRRLGCKKRDLKVNAGTSLVVQW